MTRVRPTGHGFHELRELRRRDGSAPSDLGEFGEFAKQQNYDAVVGLRSSVQTLGLGDFDALVEGAAQVDLLVDPQDGLTIGDVEQASGLKLTDYAGSP